MRLERTANMIKGTTQEITFRVPIDLRNAVTRIVFKQPLVFLRQDEFVITKDDSEITKEEALLKVRLTQKDTNELRVGDLFIQIKYMFSDGTVGASNIMQTTVTESLDNEEMKWQ